MSAKDLEKAIKQLKAAGYKVATPTDELVVKSFKVRKDVAEAFYAKIRKEDFKVQDAIEEAMREWTAKR
jgi:hypothetical protein